MALRRHGGRVAVLLLAAAIFASSNGRAQSPPAARYQHSDWGADELRMLREKPTFLPRDWRRRVIVPDPPDSEGTAAELKAMRGLVAERPARAAEIARQADGAEPEFIDALGVEPKSALPTLKALISATARDGAIVVFYLKEKFSRIRPWQLDPDLGTIVEKPAHPAYPSGHATQGMLVALMLGALYPKCRDTLLALGDRIGRNREIAGVHYKSDTDAGQLAAHQIWGMVSISRRFKAKRAEAHRAIRSVSCH